MPTKAKVDDPEVEDVPEPKPEPEPKSKKVVVDRSALTDELEQLKAQGNPNPARLDEIKKALVS